MNILISNTRILQPDGSFKQADIKIEKGLIAEIGENLDAGGMKNYDAKGLWAAPGLIDLHIHLREPGGEIKETIETGTKAAVKGGFTTVAAMPNTRPVPDHPEQMQWLASRIEDKAYSRVLPYAAITERQLGRELNDFIGLKEAGAFAFTDDGVGVQSAGLMLEAMKKAASINMAIVAHCEDNTLIYGGAVHEGTFSEATGLPGIPSVCEAVHIARDVLLAEESGCHYHVCHISTKESVRAVRDAKRAGIRVTAEVTPHHLLLCDEDIPGDDALYKMNPPLRSREDQAALIDGLLDGTIDFIATDHAPHTKEEKQKGMRLAPFGIVGLETALPLLYTHFYEKGKCSLNELLDWLTAKPAEAFKLPYGTLGIGSPADLVLIDTETKREINPDEFASKGKNTPFGGWECKGWPAATFVGGILKWSEGEGWK